jgi:hypothetical protein
MRWCIPMVEDMATETWLWVRSILPIDADIFSEITGQGKMLYVCSGKVGRA